MPVSTHPTRWSIAHTKDEAAGRLADLALAANDGESQHFEVGPYSRFVYPTRRNTEDLMRKALTPFTNADEWVGYGKSETFPKGITPLDLFTRAIDFVIADPGEDQGAIDRLMDIFLAANDSDDAVETVVRAAALAVEGSLWYDAVTRACPEHPQTPGSDDWNKAEAAGNPHESLENPLRGWS